MMMRVLHRHFPFATYSDSGRVSRHSDALRWLLILSATRVCGGGAELMLASSPSDV